MSLQDVSPVKQEVVMMVEGKKEEEEGEGKRKRRKTTTKNYSPRRNLFRRGQKVFLDFKTEDKQIFERKKRQRS